MQEYSEIIHTVGKYELCGYLQDNRSNKNLVLIPGSYTHHSIWKPVLQSAKIEANILLVELPGFGKSTPRIPDGTVELYTELTLSLVNAAGIDRFFAGGHSLGGMMAIEMLDHVGSRLDGIISCEGWTHHSVEELAFRNAKNGKLTAEQLELRTYYGTVARTQWSDAEIEMYKRIWRKWEKGRQLLESAELPILEIWGDRGWKDRPSRTQLQIPDKPNIELVWVEDGGHSFLVQFPDRIGEFISSFLRRTAA